MASDTIFSPLGSTIEASEITDGTITAGKLASDAVETAKIKASNVTEAKLATVFGSHTFIDVWNPFSVGQGTWAVQNDSAKVHGGNFYNTTTADGDNIHYKVFLTKGTYSFNLMYTKGTGSGILDVDIDSTEVASIDGYNGSASKNQVDVTTGISVTASGVKLVTLRVDGKNGSSSDYGFPIQSASFTRTA